VRAADKLNRVQSNVTTRVKQMEQKLEVALFRRRGRSLILTEAGRVFQIHAERLLRLADEAESAMKSACIHGPIHLGTMESTIASRLPPLLTRFHAQHPDIRLRIETGTTDALLKAVREHRLDAAFVGEPCLFSGLQNRPVFHENLVLITAKGHQPITTPQDISNKSLLVFNKGCAYRKTLEDWFSDHDLAFEQAVELASYQAIIACAAAGSGCGIVPASVLETTLAAQEVEKHKLPARFANNTTHLVWDVENTDKLYPLFKLIAD